jgi:hypothetical protein
MALLVGVTLALAVGLFARITGLDRDRAFYTTVAIVVAFLYSLFAVLGESTHALVVESLIGAVFLVVATLGFGSSFWLVAIALGGHGLFDFVHGAIVANPGVPGWWPAFCGAYDVTAAAGLAWLLAAGRLRADNRP